jgi:hypothetical protein
MIQFPHPTGGKPCSCLESPPIPAQLASAMTGLSRRRSRVRALSLSHDWTLFAPRAEQAEVITDQPRNPSLTV